MARLLLLFILVPAVELALLIEVGSRIGTLPTLALIALTGAAGAALARQQGLRVVREVQERLARGELPAGALLDGVLILVAGALLLTPGILTDVVGFLCLMPGFRNLARAWLMRRLERAVRERRVAFRVDLEGFEVGGDEPPEAELRRHPVIDVERVREGRERDADGER